MVEKQSSLEKGMHKTEDLRRGIKFNTRLAFNPQVGPYIRQQARDLIPIISQEMEQVSQQKAYDFKGDKPSSEIQPRARFPRSTRPQRSSTLRRQVVMDTEELNGGRKRRRTRRRRRNNVKKSNK